MAQNSDKISFRASELNRQIKSRRAHFGAKRTKAEMPFCNQNDISVLVPSITRRRNQICQRRADSQTPRK